MMKTPLRLGIVGAGIIWKKAHRPALENMGADFLVCGFCVASDMSKEWVRKEHPGVKIYPGYEEMAESPEIDAMVVLTPIALNAKVATAALRAGKHVFVEKPMAASSADASGMLEMAARMNRHLFVLENACYSPLIENVRSALEQRMIGTLVMFEKVTHGFLDDDRHAGAGYGKTQWRKEAKFPLGCLFDGGIHDIAVHSVLFGNPVSVSAAGIKFREGFGDYDEVSMFFRYANSGFKGFYSNAGYLSPKHNYWNIRGTDGVIHLAGPDAFIEKNDGSRTPISRDGKNTHEIMWGAIARAIADGTNVPYDARQAAFDVRVLEAVAGSVKTGVPVTV